MSVVYFTNNADDGDGSLRVTIASAQPGDVVRPDETVFERGSLIEIALATMLNVDKSLTLDGGAFRVVLNGDGCASCCVLSSGASVEFTSFDFVGGGWDSQTGTDVGDAVGCGLSIPHDSSATLSRCGFFGCRGTYGGGIAVGSNSIAELSDCVIVGCYARSSGAGLRSQGLTKVYSSTIIGNVDAGSTTAHDVLVDGSGRVTLVNSIVGEYLGNVEIGAGCVVGVAPSQIGFVASPTDDLSAETWNVVAWRNWDLRLLDDASPNPSPYRDAGDVDAASKYDFDGNFRGRKTGGVATRSPGAYETIQADLFCIANKFLPGAPTDLSAGWLDQTSTTVSTYIHWSNNLQNATSFQYQRTLANSEEWGTLGTLSASSSGLKYSNVALGTTYGFRIRACINDAYTDWSTVFFIAGERVVSTTYPEDVTFGSPYGWAASRFATESGDAAPQIGQTVFVDGRVHFVDVLSTSSTQTFGLAVGGGAVVAIDAASRVYFGELQIALGASFALTSQTQPKTLTRCGAWSRLDAALIADKPCDFDAESYVANATFYNVYIPNAATYGALKIATSTFDVIRLSGEYVCDAFSTAQNGALTGQTIRVGDDGATIRARSFQFGGASAADCVESFFDRPVTLKLQDVASVSTPSTSRESWADDFLIDVTDATSATLTLCGQTVYGDAPTAAVELSGSAKIDERGLDIASLTVNADATFAVNGGKVRVAALSVADGATVAFSPVETDGTAGTYADAVLSATTSVTVGAATFAGRGYFATPPETDLTSATFAETVRACDYGAGLQTFSVVITGKSVVCRWTSENIETPILIERQVDNVWEVVEPYAANGETISSTESSGNIVYRAFDGATFLQTSIYIAPFHAWLTYDNLFTSAIVVKSYTIVTEHILMSTYFNAGEAPIFLARIADSLTSVSVVPSDVESIVLTVYKLELYRGVKRRVALDGWEDVAVPPTAVMESLITDDPRWKRDSIGYNFRFEPDLRKKELFKDAGEYVAVVTMKFKEGNPAPLVFNITIK